MATASHRPVTISLPSDARLSPDAADEPGRTLLLLSLSEEMNERIEQLARRADVSKAEILNRAVGLYKALADAVAEGKRVGILADPDVELETEFVDF
jgi:hypothetical protein